MSNSLRPHGLSMEFSRQKYWSGLPFPSPGDLPNPGIESVSPVSPALPADFLPAEPMRGQGCVCHWTMLFPCYPLCYHLYVSVLVTQSYLTLCDPMHCSLPGSSIHGILQGRILEWVAIPFSSGSSQPGMEPGSPAMQEDSLGFESPGTLIRMGKPYCAVLSWWKFQS